MPGIGTALAWAGTVLLALYALYLAFSSNFNVGNLLVWLLAIAVCLLMAFRRALIPWLTGTRPGKALLALAAVGGAVYAAMLVFVAVSGYANAASGQEPALVVLGAGLRGDRPSLVLRYRLDAAYDFAVRHPNLLVVTTGGQGRDELLPEGEAMRRYLIEKGLDPARVVAEMKSTSTEENFAFAREILLERGVDPAAPVAYVTNAFHCYRAGCYARLVGFPAARAVPAGIPLQSVLPCYLREVLAVLYYWVFRRIRGGPLQGVVGIMSLQKRFFYR